MTIMRDNGELSSPSLLCSDLTSDCEGQRLKSMVEKHRTVNISPDSPRRLTDWPEPSPVIKNREEHNDSISVHISQSHR